MGWLEILSLVGTALAPVIFLFTYIYLRDKYQREPLRLLVLNFLMGVLIALPVVLVEIWLGKQLDNEVNGNADPGLIATIVRAFFIVALVEEGFKFLALMIFAYPRKAFDEPYDGIVYAVAVSLGFAAIENVLYTINGGLGVGLLRALTAVPGHAMMGVLMGYFVGMAKFSRGTQRMTIMLILGLVSSTIVHGLYDFFLMYNEAMVFPLAFVVLLLGIFLGLRAMRIHQRHSPFMDDKSSNPGA